MKTKKNIKKLIDVGLQLAPQDAQQAIAAKQELIDKLNKEIQATTAQIKQLTPMVPGAANADTDTTLKRENNF